MSDLAAAELSCCCIDRAIANLCTCEPPELESSLAAVVLARLLTNDKGREKIDPGEGVCLDPVDDLLTRIRIVDQAEGNSGAPDAGVDLALFVHCLSTRSRDKVLDVLELAAGLFFGHHLNADLVLEDSSRIAHSTEDMDCIELVALHDVVFDVLMDGLESRNSGEGVSRRSEAFQLVPSLLFYAFYGEEGGRVGGPRGKAAKQDYSDVTHRFSSAHEPRSHVGSSCAERQCCCEAVTVCNTSRGDEGDL